MPVSVTANIRRIVAAAIAVALLLGRSLDASAAGVPVGWAVIYDFLVQDVCVDSSGGAIVGLSPLEKDCVRHRDLLPGEPLTYHKADWPGHEDTAAQPSGYQRSDSYPFQSSSLGAVVVQTFDFGGGDRKFGAFDHGDGGQVVAFSVDSASVVLTEDGGRGLQLMAGPKCTGGKVAAARLLDSWMLVAKGSGTLESGNTLAKLRIVTDDSCPTAFDYAYTEWHMTSLRYRASLAGDMTAALRTLVSSHFGGTSVARARHLERFYFTRELGWTRWERWQNNKYGENPDKAFAAAQRMTSSARCSPLEPAPAALGPWLMTDCREWTNIAKPDSPVGDQPKFWLERLRDYPLTREMFSN
jgi:hypothetical protein